MDTKGWLAILGGGMAFIGLLYVMGVTIMPQQIGGILIIGVLVAGIYQYVSRTDIKNKEKSKTVFAFQRTKEIFQKLFPGEKLSLYDGRMDTQIMPDYAPDSPIKAFLCKVTAGRGHGRIIKAVYDTSTDDLMSIVDTSRLALEELSEPMYGVKPVNLSERLIWEQKMKKDGDGFKALPVIPFEVTRRDEDSAPRESRIQADKGVGSSLKPLKKSDEE